MGKQQKAQAVEVSTRIVRTPGGRNATAAADFGDYVLQSEEWVPDGTKLSDDELNDRVRTKLENQPDYPRLSTRGAQNGYQEIQPKSATALAWQNRQRPGVNN